MKKFNLFGNSAIIYNIFTFEKVNKLKRFLFKILANTVKKFLSLRVGVQLSGCIYLFIIIKRLLIYFYSSSVKSILARVHI